MAIDVGKAIWYKIIREGLGSGYSAYRTLQVARSLGLKIRTETFYRMWHEVTEQLGIQKIVETYPSDKPLHWAMHPKTEYNFPSKYGYVVEYTDAITGQKRTVGLYENRTLSPRQIYEETLRLAELYGEEPTKIRVAYLWRR